MPLDKSPIILDDFKGLLWTDRRDNSLVKIPFEYSYNCRNLEFTKKGGLRSRKGILTSLTQTVTGTPVQFWKIDNLNGVAYNDRWLILTWDNTTGRLYDTGVTAPATNPVLTLTGMKYAFVLNAFGRMYISPWESWAVPLSSAYIWLYNGKYNARLTMCPEPTPGTFAASATAGGNCTPGVHLLSVVFETDTGFRSTVPTTHLTSPLSVTTTSANGTVHLTNIPVFAGTASVPAAAVVARHIIMTKVVVNYNNKAFDSYEPFIVATINDNTTTTLDVNVPDSGLTESAKLLVNQTQSGVRAHVGMATYRGRMVYLGSRSYSGGDTFGLTNSVTYSPPNQPEQLRNTLNDGLRVVVGVDFSGKVMTGQEMNGVFYIFKEDSTFAHRADDSVDPLEWEKPELVDSARGAYPFGICNIGNNLSAIQDGYMLIAGNHGISLFSGSFATTPLTEGIWEAFNKNDVIWTKIGVDPIRKTIYFRIGDPASTRLYGNIADNIYIHHGNYYYGIDIQSIRWSIFEFGNNEYGDQIYIKDIDMRQNPLGGPIASDVINNYYTILTSSSQGALVLTESLNDRDNNSSTGPYPSWIWESGLTKNDAGEVYTFGPLKLRITGTGGAVTSAARVVDGTYANLAVFTPVAQPGKYYSLNLAKDSEHLQIKISGQCKILIERLILHYSKLQLERPRV